MEREVAARWSFARFCDDASPFASPEHAESSGRGWVRCPAAASGDLAPMTKAKHTQQYPLHRLREALNQAREGVLGHTLTRASAPRAGLTIQAEFRVEKTLPTDWTGGLFQPGRVYSSWLRLSEASGDRMNPTPSFEWGIKLGFSANTTDALVESPADFLLHDHPTFFLSNASEVDSFLVASEQGCESVERWLERHPRARERIHAGPKTATTRVLAAPFWSVLPFRFGDGAFCKYKLTPVSTWAKNHGPDWRADLARGLGKQPIEFVFWIQPYRDPTSTPLDRASIPWPEALARPIPVARIYAESQDVLATDSQTYGETLTFDPWRVPAFHKPCGSLAQARQMLDDIPAVLRRSVVSRRFFMQGAAAAAGAFLLAGDALGKSKSSRRTTSPADGTIVRAKIHPGIGVARVGNSTEADGYFVGPEVLTPPTTAAEDIRDSSGALKRQAARFRIYGYNAAGEVVRELTREDADIRWCVHVANKKADWYQFLAPFDMPESETLVSKRRNAHIAYPNRSRLIIDPGPRTIDGSERSGPEFRFDGGAYEGTAVSLGELRTDEEGRLLVLGGHGRAESPKNTPVFDPEDFDTFNNADGWFDDISDGPVEAEVTLNGQALPVDSAWVVVAPPNYAPDIIGWRTLYDLLSDAYIECGWLEPPETLSFTQDVLPILQRLSNLQWVNQGFAALFGKGAPLDFKNPTLLQKLSYRPRDPSQPDPFRELRRVILNAFRPPNNTADEPRSWPWLYGDAYGSFPDSARNNLALSEVRAATLRRWADGDFVNDWNETQRSPCSLDDIDVAAQPAMLDQAALHFCLADAFHPGCELTWPMRHVTMYREPFRIRTRAPGEVEPDWGETLTPTRVLQPGGPLYAQGPGDLTRWMALPWQGDTANCRSGYDPEYDPFLPSFWPARVPNQVLSEAAYARAVDDDLPRPERLAAFQQRESWFRPLSGSVVDQIYQMINAFDHMGTIEARPGVEDDPDLPPTMFVETFSRPVAKPNRALAAPAASSRRQNDRLTQAGWESQEQLDAFRRLRYRR